MVLCCEPQVILQGWLEKRSDWIHAWNRRFLVLLNYPEKNFYELIYFTAEPQVDSEGHLNEVGSLTCYLRTITSQSPVRQLLRLDSRFPFLPELAHYTRTHTDLTAGLTVSCPGLGAPAPWRALSRWC